MKIVLFIAISFLLISCENKTEKPNPVAVKLQEKGLEFHTQNKKDSAIFYYNKALKVDPTDITTYESIVKLFWWNEQPENALEILANAPKEMQNHNSILIFKGMTLERMNKLNDAKDLYKIAFAQSPKVKYKDEQNRMEFFGYLILQTVAGQKQKAVMELDLI